MVSEKVNIIREAHRAGKLVVTAIVKDGPNAGGGIANIVTPAVMLDGVAAVKEMPQRERENTVRSVADAVREAVALPVSLLSPANDRDLMDDIALLMALRLVVGDEVLQGSGLLELAFAIDEDESLPWQQRGMFDPKVMLELNLSPRAITRVGVTIH
jgi:hypothetical protein